MKRKDDLLRLAFGELSDDAARTFEARVDDAERAEIAVFRQLYDDLRHLPSPPPDNLSAERLRAAILDRDLKTRQPFAWGPFLFAPVALAAFAAVVILPRLRPRPEPQIVAMDASRIEAPAPSGRGLVDEFRFQSQSREGAPPFPANPPKVAVPASTPRAKAERAPSSRRRAHRRPPSEPVEEPQIDTKGMLTKIVPPSGAEEFDSVAASALVHDPKTPTIAAPASTVEEAPTGSAAKTETVVIVSSKRDLETGAPAATEKEVAGVLVGG